MRACGDIRRSAGARLFVRFNRRCYPRLISSCPSILLILFILSKLRFYLLFAPKAILCRNVARVAQLDRVTASEAAGCGFNSRHAHHFQSELMTQIDGVFEL